MFGRSWVASHEFSISILFDSKDLPEPHGFDSSRMFFHRGSAGAPDSAPGGQDD